MDWIRGYGYSCSWLCQLWFARSFMATSSQTQQLSTFPYSRPLNLSTFRARPGRLSHCNIVPLTAILPLDSANSITQLKLSLR